MLESIDLLRGVASIAVVFVSFNACQRVAKSGGLSV